MAKKKVPLTVQTQISREELFGSILDNFTHKQIHQFIVDLDRACQDWGVTEKLYKHFKKEMKKCPDDEDPICEIPFAP